MKPLTDRLTVAIDAAPTVGDRTGVGVAVAGMVAELAARDDLEVAAYGMTTRGWWALRRELPAALRRPRAPMPAGALLRIWSRFDAPVIETWTGRVDIVHGTNFVVPPARHAARIVTVWDLTTVHYPELCTPTSRRYPALIRRAVQQGAWVHTGAATIAAEIVETFGADPERVVVVAPGLEVAAPEPPGDAKPYVLGLGTTEPRKDFPRLIEAFDRVAALHPDVELRIAGPPGWAEGDVAAAMSRSPFGDRIIRTGWVSDAGRLIAGATVFAYPSVYEGFGLPPLEAMALGVPVVATSAGALPEVLGDAAVMVPPGDTEALAEAIESMLSDQELRMRMVAAGRDRAAAFTWRAAGDALVALYRRASAS